TETGERVLLFRAQEARDVVPHALRARGRIVDDVAAYATRFTQDPSFEENVAAADILTFTSSSTVAGFCSALGDARAAAAGKIVACIGPITAETACDAGLHVGALTFGFGGLPFAAILLAFFVPSVILSRVGRARKRKLMDIDKGGARDAWQVLANGGIGTVCAIVAGSGGLVVWFCAFAGAYAAAAADTWGTEIGTLAAGQPRSVLTLRPMPAGLSGGVTLRGTLAEIAGAAWIASIATVGLHFVPYADRILPSSGARLISTIAVAGIAGAVVDSILGATVQELRRCAACDRTCETNPHVCGAPTSLVRGIRGFTNDLVNGAATLTGAVTAFALARG
ncbi:MAG: DUF92 domain-containing protein, partial [Candidatus Velthaea sp.]